MGNVVAEIFGYAVVLVAILLVVWELTCSRNVSRDAQWLHSPARLKRRLIMAVVLLAAGLLIILEVRGILVLKKPQHLLIFVASLAGMALALVILSLRDLGDMARGAERQAIQDLQSALSDERRDSEESDANK